MLSIARFLVLIIRGMKRKYAGGRDDTTQMPFGVRTFERWVPINAIPKECFDLVATLYLGFNSDKRLVSSGFRKPIFLSFDLNRTSITERDLQSVETEMRKYSD